MNTTTNRYAGFWRQLWAGSLDIVIAMLSFTILFIAVFAILSSLFQILSNEKALDQLTIWFQILLWVYYFLYRTLCISSRHGASYGMRALNIRIVDDENRSLSFSKAAAREVLTYISSSIFWLGYLIIPFTEKKQGLHDMVVHCVVIKKD